MIMSRYDLPSRSNTYASVFAFGGALELDVLRHVIQISKVLAMIRLERETIVTEVAPNDKSGYVCSIPKICTYHCKDRELYSDSLRKCVLTYLQTLGFLCR